MPVFDFSCECGWTGEMLQSSYNDAPPLCPLCGKPTDRLFSPTNALFIAEWSRSENIEPLRSVRDRTERDAAFAARRKFVQQVAARLNESVDVE